MIPLTEGILFGLLLSLSIGPVFFVLLQTSLEKGRIYGVFVAFGAVLSDGIILSLCLFGMMKLAPDNIYGRFTGFLGVLVLIISGISLIRKSSKKLHIPHKKIKERSPASFLLKGFLINSLNPFVIVFWIGIIGFMVKRYNHERTDVIMFIIGILMVILLTDLLKVFLSDKVRPHMKSSLLNAISASTGLILIVYGIILFYKLV